VSAGQGSVVRRINVGALAVAVVVFLAALMQGAFANPCVEDERHGVGPITDTSKLALLIGINAYTGGIPPLEGAVNDVCLMRDLLLTEYGFPAENIVVLADGTATRKGIIDAFQRHLGQAQSDSIVVIHYSGHGTQIPDLSGDESDIDGLDEAITPVDSTEKNVREITDDELNALVAAVPGEHVTVILDNCNSGSGVRGVGRVREFSRRSLSRDNLNEQRNIKDSEIEPLEDYAKSPRASQSKYVLISGSRFDQLSYEIYPSGVPLGALTYHLWRTLRAQPHMSYAELGDRLSVNLRASRAGYETKQTPQLEGRPENLERAVFSDERITRDQGLVVHTRPAGEHTSPYIYLEVGSVHGIVPGTEYEIFQPETRDFSDRSRLLTTAVVTNVRPFGAIATARDPVPNFSRARLAKRVFMPSTVIIGLDRPSSSPALKEFARRLKDANYITLTPHLHEANMVVRATQRDDALVLTWPDGVELERVGGVDREQMLTRAVDRLEKWAHWLTLRALRNHPPELDFGVELVSDGKNEEAPSIQQNQGAFSHGDEFEFRFVNRSSRPLYFAALYLDPLGAVSVLFPNQGDSVEPVGPGQRLATGTRICATVGSANVEDCAAAGPANGDDSFFMVKIIARTKPFDVRVLEQTRGADYPDDGADPLQQLLNARLAGTRGQRPIPVPSRGWATRDIAITVRK